MSHHASSISPYPLASFDSRVHVTVHPGRPAYLYVTYDGVSEGEIDAVLLDLAAQIPAPSCVVMIPALMQQHLSAQRKEQQC
jgi:hypothetical protein